MENNESLFAGTFQLDDFQKALGYEFKDKGLLQKALTHSSYCSEHGLSGIQSNERLEFMGDGYLNAIIASELYRLMHDCAEGSLSRMRASIVCEKSLGEVGKKLKIGEYIKLGRGELKNGGFCFKSISPLHRLLLTPLTARSMYAASENGQPFHSKHKRQYFYCHIGMPEQICPASQPHSISDPYRENEPWLSR